MTVKTKRILDDGSEIVEEREELIYPWEGCENSAQYVDKVREKQLTCLSKSATTLENIHQQITELLYQREMAIDDLSRRSQDCVGFLLGNSRALMRIVDAYRLAGWTSNLVKSAVARIRDVFLDDSKRECQKYLCVDIKEDSFSDPAYQRLDFIFMKDQDSRTGFKISIPYKESVKYNWKYAYLNGNYSLSKLTGGNYHDDILMITSLKFDNIREVLLDYILNGTVVKASYNTILRDTRDHLVDMLVGRHPDYYDQFQL